MPVKSFSNPFAFAEFARPRLESFEALNNMPLGIAATVVKRPEIAAKALMLGIEEGEDCLVAIQTSPFYLVLGQTSGAEKLLPELVSWLDANQPGLNGLIAPLELAEAFRRLWARPGRAIGIRMEQRVYSLSEVIPPRWPAGHFRLAAIGDLGALLGFSEAFLAEALPHEKHDSESLRQRTLAQIDAGDIGVWDCDDRVVSMACRVRKTTHGWSISLVYSPPELRGRGYASACVAGLSQHLLDQGNDFCCLFTDLANPTSNSIYQKIGYQPVGDVLNLAFEASDHDPAVKA